MSDLEVQTQEDEGGMVAYILTNEPAKNGMILQQILDMFYRGVFSNTIGVGSVMNTETGVEELLLVGIEHRDDGLTNTYPIAKVLGPTDAPNYVFPDCKGGWLEHGQEEEAHVH